MPRSSRPGTNDYDVDPAAIALAVRNTFVLARSERALADQSLKSLAFPLLGAGRGGLDPAISFAWIWATVVREIRGEAGWEIHFIARRHAAADIILAGLNHSTFAVSGLAEHGE
jgi:O-acetyl-ADP-ribose deacetylase (regulator of RNase III)